MKQPVYIRSLKHLVFVLLLLMFCTACSWFGGDTNKTVQMKSSRDGKANSMPATIGVGTQPCPATINSPSRWQQIVVLNTDQSIERVLCGNLLGIPALQAVVLVRHGGNDNSLDVFVYTEITMTQPREIFNVKGLLHGDAKISAYNTLLTAQEDRNSRYNKGQTNQWTVDLCREYKWSDAAGTLIQVAFSGIFPDLTRYQAEFEQSEVNNGQGFQQWRLSAITTTQRFCQALLNWPVDTPVKIISGGGIHDIHAIVQVKQTSSLPVTIKLDRLERNANGGLWEIIDVQTDTLTLNVASNEQTFTSPVAINGRGGGNSTAGTLYVLDHVYNDSGTSGVWSTEQAGTTSFSKQLPYTLSFHGVQEGIIELTATNGVDNSIEGITIEKVLLGE